MFKSSRLVILLSGVALAAALAIGLYSLFSMEDVSQTETETSTQGASAGSALSPANVHSSRTPRPKPAGLLQPAMSNGMQTEFDRIAALPADSVERAQQLQSLARRWAESDPAAVVDWALLSGQNTSDQRAILRESLSHWARIDPAAAFEHLQGISVDSPSMDYAHSVLLTQWSSDDGAAAWEAFQLKNSGPTDYEIRAEVLMDWADQDASAVSAVISEELLQGRDEAHLASAVVRALTKQDLQSAVAWVNSLPNGKNVSVAASAALVGLWAEQDPTAAANWLLDRPASAARDAGIQSLALAELAYDPETAVAWSADMNPGTNRDWMLRRTIKAWLNEDIQAASDYLNGRNEFSSRDKQEMIRLAQEEHANNPRVQEAETPPDKEQK